MAGYCSKLGDFFQGLSSQIWEVWTPFLENQELLTTGFGLDFRIELIPLTWSGILKTPSTKGNFGSTHLDGKNLTLGKLGQGKKVIYSGPKRFF